MTKKKASLDPWNVTMLGSSRVGKTSLLTALRVAGIDVFSGTAVSIEVEDEATRTAFTANDTLMRSELSRGRFKPDLPGDAEAHTYGLVIDTGVDTHLLTLRFQDYPGGWLSTDKTDRVRDLMADSPTVIIPIDATLVMEAGASHRHQVFEGLRLVEVEDKVRFWAKERRRNGDATRLILVPVKCESYFTDNGGRSDKSEELFTKVRSLYDYIVQTYLKEAGESAQMLYAPVDTIGPIEYVRADWVTDQEGRQRLQTEYRVRMDANGQPRKREIRGAEPILAQLVRDVISTQELALVEAKRELEKAGSKRRSNWFKRTVDNWSGRHEERQREMEALKSSLERLASSTGTLPRDQWGRVRQWV